MSRHDEQPLPATVEAALVEARPQAAAGLARRVGLRGVLQKALGMAAEPERIGRFAVERQVGSGGMGVVYRARDPDSGEPVAIKLLDPVAREERARFQREARVLRSLAHPHVVRYLEHGVTAEGLDFLVMEWLAGRDLGARLRRGPLSVRDALTAVSEAAQGLAAVHAAGIVHRDVKPTNLFCVGDRVTDVRVMDFGIAATVAAGTRLTRTGAVLGTPQYMAPEQLRGRCDARTDVYGLGATLFECLAGRPPFIGDQPSAVLLAVVAEAVPSLSAFRSDVPGALDGLVGRMLAKEAEDRPASMGAVLAEIGQIETGLAEGGWGATVLSRAERRPRAAPTGPTAARSEPRPGAEAGTVGRAREVALLGGVLDQAAEEEMALRVLITGDPGMGKSSLLGALAALATSREPAWTCLRAHATREGKGVPFAVLRALVESEPAPSAQRNAVARQPLLDRLAAMGLGAERDGVERGRVDPLLEADRLVLAWLDLLEAWTVRAPLLLLVDDAHLADLPSMRLLGRALAHLAERAVVVATTAPTERPATGAATAIVDTTEGVHVHLGPLRPRAAARLAARWAPDRPREDWERAARLSAGNPAHLRELVRELGEGFRPASGSLAELVWRRLERLAPEERRTLRAASLVGHQVWPAAVAHLLGLDPDDAGLRRRLRRLVADGHLRPSSGALGEAPLEFAGELVHLAAYDSCSDEDRRRGHLAMTRWLPGTPAFSEAALAHHLRGAGEDAEAARHYLAAARAALAGGDTGLLEDCLELAGGSRPTGTISGEIAALRAQSHFWRGRTRAALAESRASLEELPPGSEAWFQLATLALTVAGQVGELEQVREVSRQLAAATPRDSAAATVRLVAICRALMQLEVVGAGAEPALWEALEAPEPDGLDAQSRAWLVRARTTRAAARSFEAAIDGLILAHRGHVEANDLRSAAQLGLYLATYYIWSGAWERAREAIDDALHTSHRLGADYLVLWARYIEGKLLTEAGSYDEARAALESVVDGAPGSPRLSVGALVYGSIAALRAGRAAEAATLAESARAVPVAPDIAAGAAAALCRAHLAEGRPDAAAPLAEALVAAPAATASIVEFDELVRLARAELFAALGDEERAAHALAEAVEAIERRAATLADPLRRNAYLARPHLVVRTLELARGAG